MCPGKASNGIGSVIPLGSALISPKVSRPLRSASYALRAGLDWTASVIRSWARDNASTPHSVCVAVLRRTLCLCMPTKGYAVRSTLEYTQRLCTYLLRYEMIVSPVIDGGEDISTGSALRYPENLVTKGVCCILRIAVAGLEKTSTTTPINFLSLSESRFWDLAFF